MWISAIRDAEWDSNKKLTFKIGSDGDSQRTAVYFESYLNKVYRLALAKMNVWRARYAL